MLRTCVTCLHYALIATILIYPMAHARQPVCDEQSKLVTAPLTTAEPNRMYTHHNVGNMVLSISNFGLWGDSIWDVVDYFTGERIEIGSEFPRESFLYSLYNATFWIGGILNGDTLVSVGTVCFTYHSYELSPDPEPFGAMEIRSNANPDMPGYDDAVSEQDVIAVYTDTIIVDMTAVDFLRSTPHKPLNVEITQKSYAWSHSLAENFVLFDMTVKNIGENVIRDAYFGVWVRPMVGFNYDFG